MLLPRAFLVPGGGARGTRARVQQGSPLTLRAVATPEALADVVDQAAQTTSYVAMNRFKVRDGQGPAFEQRWAQRKSSLKKLQGFEWFSLMRRVQSPDPDDEYTYSSFTWWQTKKNFNSWRSGPAFKEAHGGGDFFSFVGMIINGLLTSKGPPKPCFWRGTQVDLPSTPPAVRFDGGPGSRPDLDGSAVLPSEVFVSLRRYGEKDVEGSLGEDSRALVSSAGLRFSQVLSRDQEPDDGAGAALLSVWDSRADFEASALAKAVAPPKGEALYEGVLVLEKDA